MTVIMLSGCKGCGKTTTLNILYEMLLSKSGTSSGKIKLGADAQHDFFDTVQYKDSNIKFYTMGDFSRAIQDEIKKLSCRLGHRHSSYCM